jgi:siroheme decarboxylase
MQISQLQREFINHFQGGFPLEERPFQVIADQLGSTENSIIEIVEKLKHEKLISRFGPLYDAARIGGGLTLAAMTVPEDRYEMVTETVNSYLEVAHNYRREHELNMWFVLATEKPENLHEVISSIEKTTGLAVFNFPKQHEFYIGLWLHLSSDGNHSTVPVPDQQVQDPIQELRHDFDLDVTDRKLISATQAGLPIEHSPYKNIAVRLGITQDEVLQRLQNMLSMGIIRRIGAVPNHYGLGLTANGMTVWDVADDKVQILGALIGQLDFISHCYQRPRHLPVWPYNLFAMVHGHSEDEVKNKVKQIETLLAENCRTHETLFSSAILKKTGLRLAA